MEQQIPPPAGALASPSTYEFRWDIEVAGSERHYGRKFAAQWKRMLRLQKKAPLAVLNLPAQHARFQLCLCGEEDEAVVSAREADITAELARLRWTNPASDSCIDGAAAVTHPAGWQGVRIWMTFARQDVEQVLWKKAKC